VIRRGFLRTGLALVNLGLLAGCGALFPRAQEPRKVARLGWLSGASAEVANPNVDAFGQGLRALGYIEGQNIHVEYRFTEGRSERLPQLASELVELKPDVLVALGTPQAMAVRQATDTIPIVFQTGDPVQTGLVSSLSRPGGNMTGVSNSTFGLGDKRLDLLKEAFPWVSRVAYLWNPGSQAGVIGWKLLQDLAPTLGVRVQSLGVRGPDDLPNAFASAVAGQADALIVMDDPWIFTYRAQPIAFAAQYRLPAVYGQKPYVEDGGLMSYGSRLADSARRLAVYVDKILKGANPGEIPVEQPTTFDFVVNLKTAQALGATFPPQVAAQVTEWIQ
jgi:putative ABC transport system substrate-binding protein